MRIIFLETVAGVPGSIAGILRHLASLRRMRRDNGWIHTLFEEAENERMHLLTYMSLKQPNLFFRTVVWVTQGCFRFLFFTPVFLLILLQEYFSISFSFRTWFLLDFAIAWWVTWKNKQCLHTPTYLSKFLIYSPSSLFLPREPYMFFFLEHLIPYYCFLFIPLTWPRFCTALIMT